MAVLTGESCTATVYWDDIVINDTSGTAQNTWPGPGFLVRATPNGAGDSSTWLTGTGGTPGSTNNYTRVDEVTPDSATSYNLYRSPTTTPSDFYTVSLPTIPGGSTINAVMVGVQFRGAATSANSSFQTQIEKASGGTISRSSSITPASTTWLVNALAAPFAYPQVLYADPDGTAWTTTTVSSMQIGVYGNTASTNYAEISNVWAYVDYSTSSTQTWNIGSTTLAGSSTVSATLAATHDSAASVSGSSSLTATVHATEHITSVSVSGGSSLTATVADKEFETVSITGNSAMTISASATHKATSTASGGSSFTVVPHTTHKATLSANGSSSLSVTLSDKEFESVTITGSSSITISPKVSRPISATFAGGSSMSATLSDKEFESVTANGTSTMSVTPHANKHLAVAFNGSSTLSAFDNDTEIITAHVVGNSSLTASLRVTKHILAAINATSSVTFVLSVNRRLVVSISGDSQVTAHLQDTSNPTTIKRTALIFGGDYPDMQQPKTSSSGIVVTQDYKLGIPIGNKYYLPL